MRLFDRKLSLLILLLTLPLLFLPKINLFSLDASETAGLRIDDIVLLFFGILLMLSHSFSNQRINKIEGWILAITAFSFFSFLINRLLVSAGILFQDAKIFYVIRLLEYFMFFYIGMIASLHFRGTAIVRAFFLWNLFVMCLQKLNLAGGVIAAGYHADVSGRVQGIASFPSEMGLLLNLLFCYMLFDTAGESKLINMFRTVQVRHFLQKIYPYALFAVFSVFIIFTGNRISILALLVCFLFRLKQEFKWSRASSWLAISLFIPLLLIGAIFTMKQTAGVYERSFALLSWNNIQLFEVVWERIDIDKSPIGNEGRASEMYDMSWWLRIHKWLFATKAFLSHPECYLQGLGPGYCGAALDGGLLRILVETGALGAFLFFRFFSSLYRLNIQTKWMVIAFAINMLFFDAYLAYKTMSLLLFICGSIYRKPVPVAVFVLNKS